MKPPSIPTTQAHSGSLTPGRLVLFHNFRGSRLAFGCDGNIDVSALFELHIIAVFIG
jgi:hypothetical protein